MGSWSKNLTILTKSRRFLRRLSLKDFFTRHFVLPRQTVKKGLFLCHEEVVKGGLLPRERLPRCSVLCSKAQAWEPLDGLGTPPHLEYREIPSASCFHEVAANVSADILFHKLFKNFFLLLNGMC